MMNPYRLYIYHFKHPYLIPNIHLGCEKFKLQLDNNAIPNKQFYNVLFSGKSSVKSFHGNQKNEIY